ncbi:hypothetical protein CS542_05385 [Pedobacter sp. IW39]|nr:hypothetical protein CS542_05385 [Pedobacter sp. IW39]
MLINKGFITTLFTARSTCYTFFIKSRRLKKTLRGYLKPAFIKYTAIVLLFLSGLRKLIIVLQLFSTYGFEQRIRDFICLSISLPVFILAKTRITRLNWRINAILISTCITVYLFLRLSFRSARSHACSSGGCIIPFYSPLDLRGVYRLFYQLIQIARTLLPETLEENGSLDFSGSIVLFLSLEVSLISNVLFYSARNPMSAMWRRFILNRSSCTWGLASLRDVVGMRHKYLTCQIFA